MASSKKKTKSKDEKCIEAIGLRESSDVAGGFVLNYTDYYPNKGRNLPSSFVKFFIPDADLFKTMGKAHSGDWLAEHKESGQSFSKFITGMRHVPGARNQTIYLLPLEFFEEPIPPDVLESLKHFASIFFGLPVQVKKVKNLQGRVPHRINEYSQSYQVDAGKVLNVMSDLVPSDAFCMAGITMCDLYPRDSWNFVFGLANLSGRCGVYSLARYLSNFGEHQITKFDERRDPLSTLMTRACKTMCHEIGHMFGLKHCIYYQCLMNGSNHLDESDSRPSFLCPLCLRKLQLSCKFDILKRYQDMLSFWESHNLKEQVDWLKVRIERLSSG